MYESLTRLVSTHTPYHTCVFTAGSAAEELLAIVSGLPELMGTAAKERLGTLPLLWEFAGPAPKPLVRSTR